MESKIEIYHTGLKEWFEPMEISFNGSYIFYVQCKRPGMHPMVDGYHTFNGEELLSLAIRGNISLNPELFPK